MTKYPRQAKKREQAARPKKAPTRAGTRERLAERSPSKKRRKAYSRKNNGGEEWGAESAAEQGARIFGRAATGSNEKGWRVGEKEKIKSHFGEKKGSLAERRNSWVMVTPERKSTKKVTSVNGKKTCLSFCERLCKSEMTDEGGEGEVQQKLHRGQKNRFYRPRGGCANYKRIGRKRERGISKGRGGKTYHIFALQGGGRD